MNDSLYDQWKTLERNRDHVFSVVYCVEDVAEATGIPAEALTPDQIKAAGDALARYHGSDTAYSWADAIADAVDEHNEAVEDNACEGGWHGCERVGRMSHTCPFKMEIHGDDTWCNCCNNCADACRVEV